MIEKNGNNYGFIFVFDSMTPPKGVTLFSSEAKDAALRPKLKVVYTSAVEVIPIHEPVNMPNGPCRVLIVNLQGREIASFDIDAIAQLNEIKRSLPHGMHIVNIRMQKNKSFQMKWMIK